MNRLTLIFVALLFFIIPSYSHAEEPIPKEEFVKITDGVLDVLDEVETIASNPQSMKIEAKKVLDKFKTVQKKYNRYVVGKWPEGAQRDIVGKLFLSSITWETVSISWTPDTLEKAKDASNKARQAYSDYLKGVTQ